MASMFLKEEKICYKMECNTCVCMCLGYFDICVYVFRLFSIFLKIRACHLKRLNNSTLFSTFPAIEFIYFNFTSISCL